MFEISKNCAGCGFCAAKSNNQIEISPRDGFLHAVMEPLKVTSKGFSFDCPLSITPVLHPIKERYVAYHKQIERRLDGSAGGVYGALLETIAKEDCYFSGAVYDENMHVHHIVTKDLDEIAKLLGHKPVQSNIAGLYEQIKDLISKGETVLFCGTPIQCHSIKHYLGSPENLILVDIISSGYVSYELWERYIKEIEEKYKSKVVDIRLYDKEFSYLYSRRITLENGRTYFISSKESYDTLVQTGLFYDNDNSRFSFDSLNERVGDITIGNYLNINNNDGLGYSYVSINTEKGELLFEKAKRRLQIVTSGNEVVLENIEKRIEPNNISTHISVDKPLDEMAKQYANNTLKKEHYKKIYSFIKLFITTTRLHPIPIFKFIWYNFLFKGISTDRHNNGFIFIAPYSALKIEKGAFLELHGPLIVGVKRIGRSRLETRLWMQKGSKLLIHKYGMFGYGSNVEIYKNALLEIGYLFSNSGMTIICGKHITIGNPVNIAKGCTVRDTNGHLVAVTGYKMAREVIIGNHCWICSDTTVMPGVKIGDGAIVGACSFVTKSIPSFTLVQGNPTSVVGYPKYFHM